MKKNNEIIKKSLYFLQNELKSIAANKIKICDEQIFNNFYINRGFESLFLEKIKTFDDILLTGRAGSGKSTLIKKVLAVDSGYCKENDFCIVLINCETQQAINSASDIFQAIQEFIYTEVFEKYIGANNYKNKKNFAGKILNESLSEATDYFINGARGLINIYTNRKRIDLNKDTFDDFINNIELDEFRDDYNDFINNIFEKKIEYLSSLLLYLKETKNINFLFILDNVDSLPHSKQISVYQNLLNFKNNIGALGNCPTVKTIISLRDENYRGRNGAGVLRVEHFNIMSQDDNFVVKNKGKNPESLIFKALSNKIHYLMSHRYKQDGDKITNTGQEASSFSAIAGLLQKWSENTYIIGDIFRYSNYSIRHAMYNILDFLLWLISEIDIQFYDLGGKSILEINSLYIGWIASKKKVIQKIEGLDLVQLEKNVSSVEYTIVGCDLSILVLNFIKNMNQEAKGLPRVKFSELVKEFKSFADQKQLKQLIYDMYMLSNEVTQSEEYGHIIYMPLHDDTFKIDDIKDETLLALYPRAEELLFLSQTFTFISLIYEQKHNKISSENYFKDYNTMLSQYIENHYIFLTKLVKVHLIELYRIYNKWSRKVRLDENWYTEYLNKFALNGKFQIEHIVELSIAFLVKIDNKRYETEIEKLTSLKRDYINSIQQIPQNVNNSNFTYCLGAETIDINPLLQHQ